MLLARLPQVGFPWDFPIISGKKLHIWLKLYKNIRHVTWRPKDILSLPVTQICHWSNFVQPSILLHCWQRCPSTIRTEHTAAFPLQPLLRKHVTMLHYTPNASLVIFLEWAVVTTYNKYPPYMFQLHSAIFAQHFCILQYNTCVCKCYFVQNSMCLWLNVAVPHKLNTAIYSCLYLTAVDSTNITANG